MKLNPSPIAALITIPGIIFILSSIYLSHGPYHLSMNSDPEYAYLFNSLNILGGVAPSHIDHPGTPLQLLGALVILVKCFFSSSSFSPAVIQEFVLLNPEEYLRAMSLIINLLLSCIIYMSGLKMYSVTRTLLPALTLQFSPICFYSLPLALNRVSPEPLLIFAVLLLTIPLASEFTKRPESEEKHSKITYPIVAGCALGLGISLKITFLPLLFFILFFSSFKRKILVLASCILFFVVFTIPILPKYVVLFDWFKSIVIHDGMYGHGQLGMPEVGKLFANLKALISREPLLFLLLAIYFSAIFFLKRTPRANRSVRINIMVLLCIACLVIAAQIAITTKHPSAHYMLPAMAATCFVNSALIYFLFNESGKTTKCIGVTFLFLLCIAFIFNAMKIREWAQNNRSNVFESVELLGVVEHLEDTLKVGVYRSSLPGFALSFGNEWSGNHYGRALARLYNDTIFYNIWDRSFYSFEGRLHKDTIESMFDRYSSVVLIGSNYSITNDKTLTMQPIYKNRNEGIYRLLR